MTSSVYTVTISGITGSGSLGLNLLNNGTIHNLGGLPLQFPLSFGSPQTFAVASYAGELAVADLRGDGKFDAITANGSSNPPSISVLLGNGNGTLQAPQTYAANLSVYGYHITVADINGDGKPDVIVANYGNYAGNGFGTPGSVVVLLNNGNGTFGPQQSFSLPVGYYATSVAVADLNGDGKPDLVLGTLNKFNSAYGPVSQPADIVMLGNGNGTFKSGTVVAKGVASQFPVVADINGDGKPDLICSYLFHYNQYTAGGRVAVLLGNGNGTFQAPRSISVGLVSIGLPWVTATDVNGDGKPDLIVATDGHLTVFLGNGNGTFKAPQTSVAPAAYQNRAPIVADMNGDGVPDLVVSAFGGFGVLLGNGDGTFGFEQTFALPSTIGVSVADMNGDGQPDIVSDYNPPSPAQPSNVDILLNNTNGGFTGQTYSIIALVDTINGTAGVDRITLTRDADGQYIDWTLNGGSINEMAINDPNGLTILGNGNNDVITLVYTNGDPLPNTLRLNGTFTINGLQGTAPLAGTTIDIERSTLFINYGSGPDPLSLIQGYIKNGYNGGTWAGTNAAGVITSAAAQANHTSGANTTGIGYADSADGQGINTVTHSIELTYTLYGDANLDHIVNSADLQRFLNFFNTPAAWDQGDFNYDGVNNSADQQIILFNFNTQLGSQVTPLAIGATPATTTTSTPSSSSDPSPRLLPTINTTGSTTSSPHPHPAKAAARKRR